MALFSLLSEIHPGSTTWGVRARVIRMYKQPAFMRPDEFGSLELIIHDEVGDRIHVSMKKPVYEKIGKNMVEGSLYIIRNFLVVDNRMTFKTTNHTHKINLYRLSVITEFEDANFPSFMYNFTDFGQLAAPIQPDDSLLIDVIGRVISYQKPFEGLTTKRMDFRIQDTENRQLSCNLWAEYIDDLLPTLENTKDKPVIVIIQFARIHQFRNEDVKIANTYHVTKVIVNAENDVFMDFMNKLAANDSGDYKLLTNANYEIYEEFANGKAKFRTIDYMNEHQDDGYYWIDATIVDIQTTKDCWYQACKKCAKKMVEEDSLICESCGTENTNQIFRYKLDVMVVDKTGSAMLLMWNKACASLIGITAAEMKALHGDCFDSIPKVIEDAVLDKRVLFEVRGSSFKNVKGSAYLTVSRVAYDDEIMALYSKIYTGTQQSTTDDQDTLTEISNNTPIENKKLAKGKEKCISEVEQEAESVDDTENSDDDAQSLGDAKDELPEKRANESSKTSSDAVYTSKKRLKFVKKEK
ncbi:hypothetical protein CASFOL_025488 [Castilleja foliolosa]|uniref:Uncharacterized protein n=1 Tax=Castilleja foliolosa TaxID=1961234 RepID=A0ABD3CSG8_9LAMI